MSGRSVKIVVLARGYKVKKVLLLIWDITNSPELLSWTLVQVSINSTAKYYLNRKPKLVYNLTSK